MVCRSSDDCRGGLVIPSVLHGAMIAPAGAGRNGIPFTSC
jgi:hypothetical protein